jgi:hypothetical protein
MREPMMMRAPWRLVAAAAIVLCLALSADTREAMGDFGLLARTIDVTPSGRGAGGAKIAVLLQAATAVEDVRLTFLRSDGIPLTKATRPIDTGRLSWHRPGSMDPEEAGELSLAAGDVLQTIVQVPIPHTGSYEIVIRAEATGPAGPVVTEGMVRIDFGVPSTTFAERDGVAEFEVKAARP